MWFKIDGQLIVVLYCSVQGSHMLSICWHESPKRRIHQWKTTLYVTVYQSDDSILQPCMPESKWSIKLTCSQQTGRKTHWAQGSNHYCMWKNWIFLFFSYNYVFFHLHCTGSIACERSAEIWLNNCCISLTNPFYKKYCGTSIQIYLERSIRSQNCYNIIECHGHQQNPGRPFRNAAENVSHQNSNDYHVALLHHHRCRPHEHCCCANHLWREI